MNDRLISLMSGRA